MTSRRSFLGMLAAAPVVAGGVAIPTASPPPRSVAYGRTVVGGWRTVFEARNGALILWPTQVVDVPTPGSPTWKVAVRA